MAHFRVRLVRYDEDGDEVSVSSSKVYFNFGLFNGTGTCYTDEDGHADYEVDLDTPRDVEVGVDFAFHFLGTFTFDDDEELTLNVTDEWNAKYG